MKKTPLDAKIDAIADMFEMLVDYIIKISGSTDDKLSELCNRLLSIENKITGLGINSSLKAEETPSVVLPPPPNPKENDRKKQFEKNSTNIRRDLMDELKDIIRKRKGLDSKNNK
jgi:hypothetical protein